MAPLIELYNAATHEQFIGWLAKEYGLIQYQDSDNPHRLRRKEMQERVRLYRNDAEPDVRTLIDTIWDQEQYREKLKRLIPVALEQNISQRVVHEVASLYDKPAVRKLKSDQERFKADEARLHLHEITQQYHRLLWLCNEILVWQFKGIGDATKLKVVTPDTFDAIPHPADVTIEAGLLMDFCPISVREGADKELLPHYQVWDDTFTYYLNAAGRMCDANGELVTVPVEHGLKRIPGVILHKEEPTDRVLDARGGRDIAAAHRGIILLNIMIMRLSKTQGERQPVLAGNLANMTKGQVSDGENPIVLPPEVTASMLDTRTEPDHYLKTKHEKLISLCSTYGMSYEQLTFEETAATTSGKSYEVRREKLTELRSEQRRRALVNEAAVLQLLGYDPDGMKIDHQEQAMPQNAVEEMQLLDLKMRVGADSPMKYLQRKDPDLTTAEALAVMTENFAEWATLITMVRALNLPLNATAANPGNDPQINGSGKIVQKENFGQLDGIQSSPQQQQGPQ